VGAVAPEKPLGYKPAETHFFDCKLWSSQVAADDNVLPQDGLGSHVKNREVLRLNFGANLSARPVLNNVDLEQVKWLEPFEVWDWQLTWKEHRENTSPKPSPVPDEIWLFLHFYARSIVTDFQHEFYPPPSYLTTTRTGTDGRPMTFQRPVAEAVNVNTDGCALAVGLFTWMRVVGLRVSSDATLAEEPFGDVVPRAATDFNRMRGRLNARAPPWTVSLAKPLLDWTLQVLAEWLTVLRELVNSCTGGQFVSRWSPGPHGPGYTQVCQFQHTMGRAGEPEPFSRRIVRSLLGSTAVFHTKRFEGLFQSLRDVHRGYNATKAAFAAAYSYDASMKLYEQLRTFGFHGKPEARIWLDQEVRKLVGDT
jgi:hypothetical protein